MRRYCDGFTMIEMLMVVAIIGIVTAISLPSFVQSLRGNRLRTAARTVIMAGRYARSMALLKQVEMKVEFDLTNAVVSVQETAASRQDPDKDRDTPEPDAAPENAALSSASPAHPAETGEPGEDTRPTSGSENISRQLDRVKIESVEILNGGKEEHTQGTCTVIYHNNGTCTPYRVRIRDTEGGSITIDVDSLAGAETSSDQTPAL